MDTPSSCTSIHPTQGQHNNNNNHNNSAEMDNSNTNNVHHNNSTSASRSSIPRKPPLNSRGTTRHAAGSQYHSANPRRLLPLTDERTPSPSMPSCRSEDSSRLMITINNNDALLTDAAGTQATLLNDHSHLQPRTVTSDGVDDVEENSVTTPPPEMQSGHALLSNAANNTHHHQQQQQQLLPPGAVKRQRKIGSAGTTYSVASSSRTPLMKRLAYDGNALPGGVAVFETRDDAYNLKRSSIHTDGSAISDPLTEALSGEYMGGEDSAPTALTARVITDDLLRDWVGWEDLDLVLTAELKIDAHHMIGADRIGEKMPQLNSLKLDCSRLPHVRLLGTRYNCLRYLWLNNCHVEDVRGIGACAPSLVELYASFNQIKDISPLMDLSETLEVLDVEGNDLADVQALQFVLPALQKVKALSLHGNPVEHKTHALVDSLEDLYAAGDQTHHDAALADIMFEVRKGPEEEEGYGDDEEEDALLGPSASLRCVVVYRAWVQALMPNLAALDDIPIDRVGGEEGEMGGEGAAAAAAMGRLSAADAVVDGAQLYAAGQTSYEEAAVAAYPRPATAVPTRQTLARLSHVYADPMDTKLTEELRLVQECIRQCDYNDILADTVDSQHRQLYSRPSTSCAAGARKRLTTSALHPHSSMGSATLHLTSQRLGSRIDDSAASPSASASCMAPQAAASVASSELTTGDVCVGSAIVSLRKRLAAGSASPLMPPAELPASAAAAKTGNSEAAAVVQQCLRRWMDEASLFDFDDGEEDNHEGDSTGKDAASSSTTWEKYRSSTLLRRPQQQGGETSSLLAQTEVRRQYLEMALEEERMELSARSATGRPPRPSPRSNNNHNNNNSNNSEGEAFDTLVKQHVQRARVLIAQSGAEMDDDVEAALPLHWSSAGNKNSNNSAVDILELSATAE